MGRHHVGAGTPGDDDRLAGAWPLRLREVVRRRRTVVFGTAAGVVSVLAIGGMVTLVRGFAPVQAPDCVPACASGPGAAEQPSHMSRTPRATPTGGATTDDTGTTFAPTVVRERKAKPRPTATRTPRPTTTRTPSPSDVPRPPWHRYRPPHGWPGPW